MYPLGLESIERLESIVKRNFLFNERNKLHTSVIDGNCSTASGQMTETSTRPPENVNVGRKRPLIASK
jgi:hypothetical protein